MSKRVLLPVLLLAASATAQAGGVLEIVFLKQATAEPAAASKQTRTSGRFLGRPYNVQTTPVKRQQAAKAFAAAFERGIREFIVDLDAGELDAIVTSERGKQAWFYNLDRSKSRVRSKHCHHNVSNIVTGRAMRDSALLNAAVVFAIRSQALAVRGTRCP